MGLIAQHSDSIDKLKGEVEVLKKLVEALQLPWWKKVWAAVRGK